MGLLDRLIAGVKKLGDTAEEQLQKEIEKATGKDATSEQVTSATAPSTAAPASGGLYEYDGRDAAEKIREVLANEFPGLEVKEMVSPLSLGGEGKFRNFDFAVYAAGQPKLFIMMIDKTTCASREYRWSKEQAEKAGVTLINFRRNEPNSVPYITQRLHKYL